MKTRAEVENLKAQWLSDPSWDIEETEGFEEYATELNIFRITKNGEWKDIWSRMTANKAALLDCSLALADYIIKLEMRLGKIEDVMDYQR